MAVRQGVLTSPQYIRRKILRPALAIEGLRTPLTPRDRLRGRAEFLHLLVAQQFAPLGIFELLPLAGFPRTRRVHLDAGTRQAGSVGLRLGGGSCFKKLAQEPRPLELIGRFIPTCAGTNRHQQRQRDKASASKELAHNFYNKYLYSDVYNLYLR